MAEELMRSPLQTMLFGVILSLLSWNVFTTYTLAIKVAVLSEQVTTLIKNSEQDH